MDNELFNPAMVKLGKKAVKLDRKGRTIKLASILAQPADELPTPDAFSTDSLAPCPIPLEMLGNDEHGDCVVVAQVNEMERLEACQQLKCLGITKKQTLARYYKLGHPTYWNRRPDNGLVMLDALKAWRKGWTINGHLYKIHAFASVDWQDHNEARVATFYLHGLQAGLALPKSAGDQFAKGLPWALDSNYPASQNQRGSWGGHAAHSPEYVDIMGINAVGPVVLTWARRQQITWAWWDTYCDECYAVLDQPDKIDKAPIDFPKLENILARIEAN